MEKKDLKSDITADIVVSGAGPAGLTLSLLLGRAGFKVVLIDAEPPAPIDTNAPSGRTAALLNSSINVLKGAGLWDVLQDVSTPLKIMKIVDDSHGSDTRPAIEFVAKDVDEEQFGFNIPNAYLRLALANKIPEVKTLTRLAPSKLKTYKTDGQKIIAQTEDGRTITASLIVGTDGRNSIVRKIAKIEAKTHDYKQMAMTCLIEHTKPHHFTSTEFHRAGGPFTFVPMPGNRSSIVWVEKTDDAKKYLAMKREEYQQAIQDRTCGYLGTVTLQSPPESWPLMMLSSEKLTGERAVLAAEAAHVLSPIGAQGLNLSLRDIATLAEILTDAARLGEDIGSKNVLDRYERRRHLDIKSHVIGIDGYNRVVANDMSFLKDMRRLGLKGLDKIPGLKNIAMHQGLLPSMDEGRLVNGSPL